MFSMAKVKASALREKNRSDLLAQLDELKKELSQLRVAKVVGGQASKLSKMCVLNMYTAIHGINILAARSFASPLPAS